MSIAEWDSVHSTSSIRQLIFYSLWYTLHVAGDFRQDMLCNEPGHFLSQGLIEPQVAADRVVDVAIGIKGRGLFRCPGHEGRDGGGVGAAHRVNAIRLVDQLDTQR